MNRTNLQFDNHDDRIRYYELLLEQNLDNLPCLPLVNFLKFYT